MSNKKEQLKDDIKKTTSDAKKALDQTGQNVSNKASKAEDEIKKGFGSAEKKVEQTSNNVVDKTKKVAEDIKNKAKDLGRSIKKKLD